MKLILKRNTDQTDIIFALQEKIVKPKVKISTMGIGAGPGHGAGGNNSDDDDTRNITGSQNQTVDTTILDNVTKPIRPGQKP